MDLSSYGSANVEITEEEIKDLPIEEIGEQKIYERVIAQLEERRNRIISGGVNCIPWNMPRLEKDMPGIEQSKFHLVTANQKVAKSQFTDYMFVFNPINYIINNPGKIKLKIFYITLEMSVEQKYQQYISHLIYILTKGRIRLSPKDLRSTSADKPLNYQIFKLLTEKEYRLYLDHFENIVTFIDSTRNPFGIYNLMREYAMANGVQHKKIIDIKGKKTEVDDYYEPNDPDEYVILVVDHLSLLTPEATEGNDLRRSIVKFTSDYCVKLRNKYKYIIVAVQQQNLEQESLDNFKSNKLRPTINGLGNAKTVGQDIDIAWGLFSPARHDLKTYLGYDITKFQDNIRFLEIIADREGGGGSIYPLYFDGAVNMFRELPLPDNKNEIEQVYNLIKGFRNVST